MAVAPTPPTTPAEGAPPAAAAAPAIPAAAPAAETPVAPVADKSPLAAADGTEAHVETPAEKVYGEDDPKPPEAKEPVEEKKEDPPEVVAYELKLPDGIEVDEPAMTAFKDFAAKEKLTPEGAQAMLDLHVAQVQSVAAAFAEQQKKQWTDTITAWKAQIDADKDLGGANQAKAMTAIGRSLDEYGSQAARDAFDLTGAGWNPDVIRYIHNMAKALSEGGPVLAPGPAKQAARGAAALYKDET